MEAAVSAFTEAERLGHPDAGVFLKEIQEESLKQKGNHQEGCRRALLIGFQFRGGFWRVLGFMFVAYVGAYIRNKSVLGVFPQRLDHCFETFAAHDIGLPPPALPFPYIKP